MLTKSGPRRTATTLEIGGFWRQGVLPLGGRWGCVFWEGEAHAELTSCQSAGSSGSVGGARSRGGDRLGRSLALPRGWRLGGRFGVTRGRSARREPRPPKVCSARREPRPPEDCSARREPRPPEVCAARQEPRPPEVCPARREVWRLEVCSARREPRPPEGREACGSEGGADSRGCRFGWSLGSFSAALAAGHFAMTRAISRTLLE